VSRRKARDVQTKPNEGVASVENMSRREFLLRSAAAGVAGTSTLALPKVAMAAEPASTGTLGTFIDLTKCVGCGLCTDACATKNAARYPEPVEDIPVNWPTGKYEDWSDKRELTDRFTPYSWTFVEKVEVGGEALNIPRKCMHCDNPPCANLCPFSVQEKTASGAVVINEDGCMGGAKCRDVCPWDVPQRQAGVGIYMKLAPGLLGGGVMYKCDMCVDLVEQGQQPACVSACPTGAQQFGPKEQMKQLAEARAAEIGGHIYGATENGGTSTFYVSPVSFEQIDGAIAKRKADLPEPMQKTVPGMAPDVENYLETSTGIAAGYAIAPIAGIAAAGWAAAKAWKGGSE
jgi:formate dehydrogenase iron-sulfur subunit